MPLRRQGVSRGKSVWYGQLSAIVEPVAGVLGAYLVLQMKPNSTLRTCFCCWCYDLRSCGGSNS